MGVLRIGLLLLVIVACSKGTAPPIASAPSTSSASTSTLSPPMTSVTSVPSSEHVEGSGEATDGSDAPFRLLYRDEFDTLDDTRWDLMTHSWGGNLALFSRESPIVEDGHLRLRLLAAPEGTRADGEDKAFLGAEVRSRDTLTYGRVRARARFAKASAVVSALVTIYTPWPADNWNELDIESLGQDPTHVQFNTMVYDGPKLEPPVAESVKPTADPYMEDLGFDASADFHEYTIEWTPESATFWVDGEQRYVWTTHIGLMTLPQNVLLTIWASDSPGWAGDVTPETTGAEVSYDWVELWEYTGAASEPTTEEASETTPTDLAETTNPAATSAESVPTSVAPLDSESDVGDVDTDATTTDADITATADESGTFALLFRDDFEQFDAARWEPMTHSWDSNLALFSEDSVSVADGFMTLTLRDAPVGTVDDTGATKAFLGAEVRSKATLEYGRVCARAKFSSGSAVVSALVTIYTPWPADNWNELDIEHLGFEPDHVQFNTMVYTGEPVTTPARESVTPTQFPSLVELGFDASADFHEYELEWTPEYAQFSVDGTVLHRWTERIELMGLPQNVLLTIWASASPEWAGPVNTSTSGAKVVYDWLEVYAYTP